MCLVWGMIHARDVILTGFHIGNIVWQVRGGAILFWPVFLYMGGSYIGGEQPWVVGGEGLFLYGRVSWGYD